MQKDIYICKGNEDEEHTPKFTYYGFQYVFLSSIPDEQATVQLLTYMVMNLGLQERENFECSDKVANILQTITKRSTLANFFYFLAGSSSGF